MSAKTDELLEKLIDVTEVRNEKENFGELEKSITALTKSVDTMVLTHEQTGKDMDRMNEEHKRLSQRVGKVETRMTQLEKWNYSAYKTRRFLADNWFKIIATIVMLISGGSWLYYLAQTAKKVAENA